MKLNLASLSFLWLIGGLGLFAWGAMSPAEGRLMSMALVGACVCWLVSLWLSLRRWRSRGAESKDRRGVLTILAACLAVLLVLGCLFYAGWLRA